MTIPLKSDGQELTAAEVNELGRNSNAVVNVKNYGAVGDGVTDDATASELRLYLAADHDTTFEYWAFDVASESLRWFTSAGNVRMLLAADGRLDIDGNLRFDSGTAFYGELDHANTANRVYTFPDVTGTVALLEGAQTFTGLKTFTGGMTVTTADVTIADRNVVLSTGTGTRFGTGSTQKLSFYGAAPIVRPSAYTQTYSTADKTLGAYTSDPESVAYAGIDNAQAGTVYATVADLNQLRVAYETLRVFTEDAVALLNAVVDDQQALGLAG